jgi:hypothetical protein
MFRGVEREPVPKKKSEKHGKKREPLMMPNLSGLKFEDLVRAMAQTPPPPKRKRKP